MLTSLRIQNFRSIRDAQVKLGQVNLFIGPNNSGKSNFLKGIELFAQAAISSTWKSVIPFDLLKSSLTRSQKFSTTSFGIENPISFNVELTDSAETLTLELSAKYSADDAFQEPRVGRVYNHKPDEDDLGYRNALSRFEKIIIYRPDPTKFHITASIRPETKFSLDGENIISFLYNLRENHRKSFQQLEESFAKCVGSLVFVSMPLGPDGQHFKLKFFDQDDIGYWAEEVSEGVLYFLALLCIVHQPDPPKLLLLEEPEKGIHPRRIGEVMDFIFELARLRGIQIILTSHSPYVVDYFADIPECISVFDRENGETVIRNAGDIITETNAELEAKGRQPIRYTDSLGEHWVSGFIGGVPV